MSNVVEGKFGPAKDFDDFIEKMEANPLMLNDTLGMVNAFVEQEAEALGVRKVFIALMIVGKIAEFARDELPSELAEMLIASAFATEGSQS